MLYAIYYILYTIYYTRYAIYHILYTGAASGGRHPEALLHGPHRPPRCHATSEYTTPCHTTLCHAILHCMILDYTTLH